MNYGIVIVLTAICFLLIGIMAGGVITVYLIGKYREKKHELEEAKEKADEAKRERASKDATEFLNVLSNLRGNRDIDRYQLRSRPMVFPSDLFRSTSSMKETNPPGENDLINDIFGCKPNNTKPPEDNAGNGDETE